MKKTDREFLLEFFDHGYHWWEDVYAESLPKGFFSYEMIRRRQIVIDEVVRNIGGRSNLRILECGCGPGGILRSLPEIDHMVVGLDINLKNLAVIRRQLAASTLVCGDIERLPFAPASFDIVLCIGVLSYLPSDEPALTELNTLLRPGGCLVLANPNLFMLDKLMDPFYLAVWPFRQILNRFCKSAPTVVAGNRFTTTMIRRYRYGQLDRLYRRLGLIKTSHVGTSFGPLRIWRKECFPMQWSIRLSETLVRLGNTNLFSFLGRLSNHWVTCLRKPAEEGT